MSHAAIDFSQYEAQAPPKSGPIDFSAYESPKPGEVKLSNPSTVPNARIRNLPNPAEGETSPASALYHGMKTGGELAMLPLAPVIASTPIPELAAGAAGGTAGGVLAKKGAQAAGAGELGQEVAGDAGVLVGGGLASSAEDMAATRLQRLYNALPKELQKEVVGTISPRVMHAMKIVKALTPEPEAPGVYPGAPYPEASELDLHPAYPGAPNPVITPEMQQATGLRTGATAPVDPAAALGRIPAKAQPPAVYPGAPFPETPSPELLQAGALLRGVQLPKENPASALASVGTVPDKPLYPAPSAPGVPTPSGAGMPRTLSGDSALRQVLTGQDNPTLLKIARSRGINVTSEAQLRPGKADNLIINKIINDMSPEELNEVGAQYLENTRFRHNFGDVGPEAWRTMSLQTYFPDVKIPQATMTRVAKAISSAGSTPESSVSPPPLPPTAQGDLTSKMAEMLKQAKGGKTLAEMNSQ